MKMKRLTGLMVLGSTMGLAIGMMNKKASSGSQGKMQKWEFAQELGQFTEKTGESLIRAGRALNRVGR